MARQKRTSTVLAKAERRAAGISSINTNLDLGNGMTLRAFWTEIDQLRDKQTLYNKLLSNVDQIYNELLAEERQLAKTSEKMLKSIAVVYGQESSEYEMAGGTRRPERKRRTQIPAQQPPA